MFNGIFLAAICSLSIVSSAPLVREDAEAIPALSTSGCIYKKSWSPLNLPAIMIPMNTMGDIDDKGMCNDTMFLEVAKGCKAVTALINGFPGPYVPPEKVNGFKICIAMLADHNVDIYGYVATKIGGTDQKTDLWVAEGMRPMVNVEEDMNKWLEITNEISGFKGFFLDNVSNYRGIMTDNFGIDQVEWYRRLVNIGKRVMKNAKIILNPGGFTDVQLLNSDPNANYTVPAEYVVGFYNYANMWSPSDNDCLALLWDKSHGSYGPGPWCPIVPKLDGATPFINEVELRDFKTIALVHSAPENFIHQYLTAAENGFQYFYATDAKWNENPWSRVPTFWATYLEILENGEDKEAYDYYSPWEFISRSETSFEKDQIIVADATITTEITNDAHVASTTATTKHFPSITATHSLNDVVCRNVTTKICAKGNETICFKVTNICDANGNCRTEKSHSICNSTDPDAHHNVCYYSVETICSNDTKATTTTSAKTTNTPRITTTSTLKNDIEKPTNTLKNVTCQKITHRICAFKDNTICHKSKRVCDENNKCKVEILTSPSFCHNSTVNATRDLCYYSVKTICNNGTVIHATADPAIHVEHIEQLEKTTTITRTTDYSPVIMVAQTPVKMTPNEGKDKEINPANSNINKRTMHSF